MVGHALVTILAGSQSVAHRLMKQWQIRYWANVAAHEVGHQLGLYVLGEHKGAKPGTLMYESNTFEQLSFDFLGFSEEDAAVIRGVLNSEDVGSTGETDRHGMALGEDLKCSFGDLPGGRGGGNFCG